ncbi:SMP-30/gluconolactonase/LRE family protein [Bosea sp. (in: a-proteobacteria)]|uniref:SMP-30/gluconolactonase/LRE family protein n=1 Tax=Bosea sp. (in: a-proteobacteria) TaxID=1871050 RepID=UPI00262FB061|nr:SMP-30/gluconolactonase/LRE family protein [Bosea sp. (in: a-proteobacteria)]MCO5089594.1 SMP-30/gluconolactonase/LRE family protein [Bosea sp. (in: a-proteobacteria)]
MSASWVKIDAPASILGEGPVWSGREQVLYWLDVVGKAIFRLDPATGEVRTRALPYAPSAIVPRADGGLLLVTKKGMALLDDFAAEPRSVPLPGIDFSQEVFNDAACDAAGRLWVGTRDFNVREPKGRLFRVDAGLTLEQQDEGFVVSNGIAWSPDGGTLYHVDSRPGCVYAHDFDMATGTLRNRRVFLDYSAMDVAGHPDGCTVDAEGGLWIAEVEGWRVARYTPDGRLDREIRLPFKKPTSVMFGGAGLDRLFITSMQFRLTDQELLDQPLAGSLLVVEPGVKGLPEPAFRLGGATV